MDSKSNASPSKKLKRPLDHATLHFPEAEVEWDDDPEIEEAMTLLGQFPSPKRLKKEPSAAKATAAPQKRRLEEVATDFITKHLELSPDQKYTIFLPPIEDLKELKEPKLIANTLQAHCHPGHTYTIKDLIILYYRDASGERVKLQTLDKLTKIRFRFMELNTQSAKVLRLYNSQTFLDDIKLFKSDNDLYINDLIIVHRISKIIPSGKTKTSRFTAQTDLQGAPAPGLSQKPTDQTLEQVPIQDEAKVEVYSPPTEELTEELAPFLTNA